MGLSLIYSPSPCLPFMCYKVDLVYGNAVDGTRFWKMKSSGNNMTMPKLIQSRFEASSFCWQTCFLRESWVFRYLPCIMHPESQLEYMYIFVDGCDCLRSIFCFSFFPLLLYVEHYCARVLQFMPTAHTFVKKYLIQSKWVGIQFPRCVGLGNESRTHQLYWRE